MADRVDQLEKYYTPIEECSRWTARFFWVCALLSFGVLYSDKIPVFWMQQVPGIIFVLAVVTHFVISHYNSFCLIPAADDIRRKQLLSSAFDIPLTPERTQSYYNNPLAPSVTRLGVCVFENAFFGKNVCQEMAKTERLRVLAYFLLWLAVAACRSTDLGIVLIFTQVLFSGDILIHWIKVEILRRRNQTIYDTLYAHFLNLKSREDHSGTAAILNSFASYESAKAAASIKQSSVIFHKLNRNLSAEWEGIRSQLGIDNSGLNSMAVDDKERRKME